MNMRTLSNRNMMSAMEVFEKFMTKGYKKMVEMEGEYKDAAVITEIFTMASISKNCCETAVMNEGSISFERTPKNRSMIQSRLGSLNMEMTTHTYKAKKTRKNLVTQAIMHAILCLVDIVDMVIDGDSYIDTIVFTDVLSVTHAAVLTLIFRCMCMCYDTDPGVTMHMLVDKEIETSMKIYVGSKFNVETHVSTDKVVNTLRIMQENGARKTYVVTHTEMVVKMITTMFENEEKYMSVLMDMQTYTNEQTVLNMYNNMNMTVEAMPISDPDMSTVRVASVFLTENLETKSYEYMSMQMSMIARMRWFNNMTRHMDIDSLCYDCWIAFRVAKTMAKAITGEDLMKDLYTHRKMYRDFVTVLKMKMSAS